MHLRRIISALAASIALVALFAAASPAGAHPHTVKTGNGESVEIANGQNHAPFVPVTAGDSTLLISCGEVGVNEDPAAYGIETAHHGPDLGTAGKADGCFEAAGPAGDTTAPYVPTDNNPAID